MDVRRVEVLFEYMKGQPAFDSEDRRRELVERLNKIADVSIPIDAIKRRPSFALSALTNDAAMAQFLSTMDWVVKILQAEVPTTEGPAPVSDDLSTT